MSTLTLAPDIESLKSRLRTTWMAGDYDRFSRFMENDARSFYERLDVPPGAHLLDIACGSGQLALIAAREGVRVTGVDIAENLIERAQARSMAEALPARFQVADAESLPFPDSSFDVVVSLIGAMFAPRPHLVARELTRVCTPGGTIAMANWTAGGFVGKMFNTIARFIAPSGMPSPLLWGDEDVVRERFGSQVCELRLARRHFTFRLPIPAIRRRELLPPVLWARESRLRFTRPRRPNEPSPGIGGDLVGGQSWAGRFHADSLPSTSR